MDYASIIRQHGLVSSPPFIPRATLVIDFASLALAGYAGCGQRPCTAVRITSCRRASTSTGTTAIASGSVPSTTARGCVITARRSIAAAAPTRRIFRRRFPLRSCRTVRSLLTAERLYSHTGAQQAAGVIQVRAWSAFPCVLSDVGRLALVGASRLSGEPRLSY